MQEIRMVASKVGNDGSLKCTEVSPLCPPDMSDGIDAFELNCRTL